MIRAMNAFALDLALRAFLLCLTWIFLPSLSGVAASETAIPERSRLMRIALEKAEWRSLEPGLEFGSAQASATAVSVLRIDTSAYRFSLAIQEGEDGATAREFATRESAVLAVNGGFFSEKTPGKGFAAVGYLRTGSTIHAKAWPNQGGFLGLSASPALTPSRAGPPSTGDVIQSKPLIIEPGGKWAMNTNRNNLRRRTILCLLPDGDAVLALFTGMGMSLFEAGWLMRSRELGGFFDCDSALALDGGGSTQWWLPDFPELSIAGDGRVHNALILHTRNRP